MAILPIPLDLRYKPKTALSEERSLHVPVEKRLQEVKRRLDEAKTKPDFFLSYYLAYFASLCFPPLMLRNSARKMTVNSSLLLTNVRV